MRKLDKIDILALSIYEELLYARKMSGGQPIAALSLGFALYLKRVGLGKAAKALNDRIDQGNSARVAMDPRTVADYFMKIARSRK